MTLKCDTIFVIPLQILATLDYNLIRLQGNFSQIINILQIYPIVSFNSVLLKCQTFSCIFSFLENFLFSIGVQLINNVVTVSAKW